MSAVSIYVYYRVTPDAQDEFARLARLHLAAVAEQLGARWRLMQSQNASATWMEVLDDVSNADTACVALAASWQASGLARFLAAGASRHIEIFEDAQSV